LVLGVHAVVAEILLKRRRVRRSLTDWCRHCGYEPALHHRLLIDRLERGEIKRLAVFMPPGSAKSTYGSILFPPYVMANAPNRAIVPTANPKRLTATANRPILAPDERSLQADLVCLDRTIPIAGCVGGRDPCPSTPTQRAAAQIPEAIGVRQYRSPCVCRALSCGSWSIGRTENSQAADGDPLAPCWVPRAPEENYDLGHKYGFRYNGPSKRDIEIYDLSSR
jgi:hypothetical protein